MSETTAKMLVHAVTGKLIPQSYDPALDAFVADKSTGGVKHVTTRNSEFKPSSYDADVAMNGTARVFALATGVSLGGGSVNIYNRGATTEAIRVAFGTSAANAEANLGLAAAAAVTGHYIPAFADGGSLCRAILSVPLLATHLAICNAVAADTQTVSVTQGV